MTAGGTRHKRFSLSSGLSGSSALSAGATAALAREHDDGLTSFERGRDPIKRGIMSVVQQKVSAKRLPFGKEPEGKVTNGYFELGHGWLRWFESQGGSLKMELDLFLDTVVVPLGDESGGGEDTRAGQQLGGGRGGGSGGGCGTKGANSFTVRAGAGKAICLQVGRRSPKPLPLALTTCLDRHSKTAVALALHAASPLLQLLSFSF